MRPEVPNRDVLVFFRRDFIGHLCEPGREPCREIGQTLFTDGMWNGIFLVYEIHTGTIQKLLCTTSEVNLNHRVVCAVCNKERVLHRESRRRFREVFSGMYPLCATTPRTSSGFVSANAYDITAPMLNPRKNRRF